MPENPYKAPETVVGNRTRVRRGWAYWLIVGWFSLLPIAYLGLQLLAWLGGGLSRD